MIKVLFVCHGNICRSPMAEFVLKDLVEKKGLCDLFEIASAATSNEECWNGIGNPINPKSANQLRLHGIGDTPYTDYSHKRARQITKADYDYYDYLLCADLNNIKNTIRITGEDKDQKINLLMNYVGGFVSDDNKSIADPWYTGDYRSTWDDVIVGCQGFLDYLLKNNLV